VSKLHLVALIVLTATAAAHLWIHNAQAEAASRRGERSSLDVPKVIGPYQRIGEDIEASDNVKRLLKSSLILKRNYIGPSRIALNMTIVFAGSSRRDLHFPEVCLVGAGWEIMEEGTALVGLDFEAKRLVLARGRTEEAVMYWFKTGDKMTGNFFLNSWYWALNQITFKGPTSSMIRLSARVNDGNSERTFLALQDFATWALPELEQSLE
jgi:EpsI family protein